MTQKTDNFKTLQIPKWQDGELANGANFEQFITAIANLISETEADAITGAVQRIDDEGKVKAGVTAFLNNPTDYQASDLYTKIVAMLNDGTHNSTPFNYDTDAKDKVAAAIAEALAAKHDFDYDTDAKAKVAADITEALKVKTAKYTYTYDGNAFTLLHDDNGEAVTLTDGAKYLRSTNGKKYRAHVLADDLSSFLLLRPDGARLVYDVTAKTIKPAANLIG